MSTNPIPTTEKASNPANAPAAKQAAEPAVRRRIPMSLPQQKLEAPPIPGYHMHWFTEARVPRAMQAGYEIVHTHELPLNQHNIATDRGLSGNQSLDSSIRIVGGVTEAGQTEWLVLMKIKEEWWKEDQAALAAKNAKVLSAIFNKEYIPGSEQLSEGDQNLQYVKTALFQRPTRKARPNQS